MKKNATLRTKIIASEDLIDKTDREYSVTIRVDELMHKALTYLSYMEDLL